MQQLILNVLDMARDLVSISDRRDVTEGQISRLRHALTVLDASSKEPFASAETAEREFCWHCGDELEPRGRPHCARCPEECDDADCQAYGCVRQREATPDAEPCPVLHRELTAVLGIDSGAPGGDCTATAVVEQCSDGARRVLSAKVTPTKPEKSHD